jgi:hypothetical protein
MTTYNIERSLDLITDKLNKIIELLERQAPKSSKDLLLEHIENVRPLEDKYRFPTPWNTPYAYATTEDVLPEHRTYTIGEDQPYKANIDPNFTNNDTYYK